jgi:hypothetical protein
MRAEQPASDKRDFAAAVLLWLHLLVLVAGALQFAFAAHAVQQPLLAVGALALLILSVITRYPGVAAPACAPALDRCHAGVSGHGACAATGAVRSSLSLTQSRSPARRCVWQLVARRVLALRWRAWAVLGSLTPNTYIGDPEFLRCCSTLSRPRRRGVAGLR